MNTTYYEIDGRKFKLEQIREDGYWLTFREDRCDSHYPFKGKTAYADALAEILSYAEIDEKDYAGTKEE